MIKTINPSNIAPTFGNYSHAAEFPAPKRIIKTSGQLSLDRNKTIPNSAFEQAKLIFANLDAILAAGNMSRENIVHLAAYVTDRSYMQEYMRARDEYLSGFYNFPASTLLIVSGFTKPEFKVEIELSAISV